MTGPVSGIRIETSMGTLAFLTDPLDSHLKIGSTFASAKENVQQLQRGRLLNLLREIEDKMQKSTFAPWLHYSDTKPHEQLPILSDTARDVLREATKAGVTEGGQRQGVYPRKNSYLSPRLLTRPVRADEELITSLAEEVVRLGAFCSVCGKQQGLKKCGGCGWESYCSTAHQKEVWAHHLRLVSRLVRSFPST